MAPVPSVNRKRNTHKNEIKPMDFFKLLIFSSIVVFFFVTIIIARSTPESKSLSPLDHQSPLQNRKIVDSSSTVFRQTKSGGENSSRCSPWPKCMLPPREPLYFPLCDLLHNWSPDETDIKSFENSPAFQLNAPPLPRFDFSNEEEYEVALKYREAEIPFIVYNLPELDTTVQTWSDAYLRQKFEEMDPRTYSIEKSTRHGHLLYYSKSSKRVRGYVPPQEAVSQLSYQEFEELASAADVSMEPPQQQVMYLTISANIGGLTDWIANALSYFRDNTKFFRVNYRESFHGINCRFGMRGIVQAAHFDHGRNFISLIKGHRRYVILHPRECSNLELLDRTSPSGRHASFDWADESELLKRKETAFCSAQATELILKEGETLYLPSYWFHYIVSLDRTIQCNSRAGNSEENTRVISECMSSSTVSSSSGF